jgi:hypothetical protein
MRAFSWWEDPVYVVGFYARLQGLGTIRFYFNLGQGIEIPQSYIVELEENTRLGARGMASPLSEEVIWGVVRIHQQVFEYFTQ